jgi:hypothetical protein
VMPVETLLVAAGIITFVVVLIAVFVPAGRQAIREGRAETPTGEGPVIPEPGNPDLHQD